MLYEFHRYELLPGKTDEYEELFGRIPFKVWQKSGAQILGVWRTVDEEPAALCYLVAYRDRAHRDECFNWVRRVESFDSSLSTPLGWLGRTCPQEEMP